jgi:hypothetical protein
VSAAPLVPRAALSERRPAVVESGDVALVGAPRGCDGEQQGLDVCFFSESIKPSDVKPYVVSQKHGRLGDTVLSTATVDFNCGHQQASEDILCARAPRRVTSQTALAESVACMRRVSSRNAEKQAAAAQAAGGSPTAAGGELEAHAGAGLGSSLLSTMNVRCAPLRGATGCWLCATHCLSTSLLRNPGDNCVAHSVAPFSLSQTSRHRCRLFCSRRGTW